MKRCAAPAARKLPAGDQSTAFNMTSKFAVSATSSRSSPAHPGPPNPEPPLSRLALHLLWVLLTIAWFGSIGTGSLISPDEGRYASLSLEMMRSGDWLTPRLNGLLYFEKPPLQYWISAIIFHLLGPTNFAARLYPALAGFLTVAMVGLTGARLWGREVGLRSLAIAFSMTWIFGNGHYLTLDAGLTLFLTLALCAVLIANDDDTHFSARRGWIWLAWAAMAGAVLSKGLVGILIPGAVLSIASLWRGDLKLWRGMHWVSGILIFLTLAMPWFVLVSLRNPGFAEFFFIHEHFARYLTNVHQRKGAWWYYIPLLVGGMFPWTGSLPWLLRGIRIAGVRSIAPADVLVVWTAFIFLFFSVSGSKLPSYILPLFPALSLLVARRTEGERVAVLRGHLMLPTIIWATLIVASPWIGLLASPSAPIEVLAPIGAGIGIGGAVALVGASVAWWSLGRRHVTHALMSLALGHLVAMGVVLQTVDAFARLKSAEAMVQALNAVEGSRTPVFAVRSYDQTLPFYLGRNVVLVDYHDEFALGERLEPSRSIQTLDDFVARWKALSRAAAYMEPVTFIELQQLQFPMKIIFRDQRRMLAVKP